MQRLFLTIVVVLPLVCLGIPPDLNAQDAVFYFNRGIAWSRKGEYDRAIADFDQALRLNPNDAAAYNHRGSAWSRKGEYDRAIADFDQALRLNPNLAEVYNSRGVAWSSKGECDRAIADFDQVLRLNPNNALVYNNRGVAWKKKGKYDRAIADFDQALRLRPNLAGAYRNLAWLQATCPDEKYRDGKAAVINADKAYQLDGRKNQNHLDTLAAAYAECGDFVKAREWEEKAIAMAPDEKSKKKYQSRLELYKQNKPYHEELKKR